MITDKLGGNIGIALLGHFITKKKNPKNVDWVMLFIFSNGCQEYFNSTEIKCENNKVLIITYYWPPAGGPGVQR
jgi:hypothetical protein